MGFTATMLQERISLDGELEREVENLVTAERVGNMFFENWFCQHFGVIAIDIIAKECWNNS